MTYAEMAQPVAVPFGTSHVRVDWQASGIGGAQRRRSLGFP